jgi:hypothetical protein
MAVSPVLAFKLRHPFQKLPVEGCREISLSTREWNRFGFAAADWIKGCISQGELKSFQQASRTVEVVTGEFKHCFSVFFGLANNAVVGLT